MNPTSQSPATRSPRQYLALIATGFAMGAADVVPGVSGGTMAFILGIYEELVNSIRSLLNVQVFKLLIQLKIKAALDLLPWKFLLAVTAGIFIAVFSLAQVLELLLRQYPALVWSFFFGLVLSSVATVSRRLVKWKLRHGLATMAGAAFAYIVFGLVPTQTPEAYWFLFISGAIAICAMVLPGISGAFILVLLGKYQYVLAAVTNRDILTLAVVIAGALVGIVTFAQVLGWLFKRFHDMTIAVLIGLMLGSLRKIWPWKETISSIVDRHGQIVPVQEANILPAQWSLEVTLALLLAIAGFLLVLGLNHLATRKERGVVPAVPTQSHQPAE